MEEYRGGDLQLYEILSSEDEQQDILKLSDIQLQLAALLQQVQDPLAAQELAIVSADSPAGNISPGGAIAAHNALSPVPCTRVPTLPAWLADMQGDTGPGILPGANATPAPCQLGSRAFAAPGSGMPGTATCSYSCRRPVPEWLVSPVCASAAAPDSRNPFRALIAEIDANLAASGAPPCEASAEEGGRARCFADLLEEVAAGLASVHSTSGQAQRCANGLLIFHRSGADEHCRRVATEEGGACPGSSYAIIQDWPEGSADEDQPEPNGGSPARSPRSRETPAAGATAPQQRLLEQPMELAAAASPPAALTPPAASPSPQEAGIARAAAQEETAASAQPLEAANEPCKLHMEDSTTAVGVRILRRSVSPQQVARPAARMPAGGPSPSHWAAAMEGDACERAWPSPCGAGPAPGADKENVSPRLASAPALGQRRVLAELPPESRVLARDGWSSPGATQDDAQLQLPDIQAWRSRPNSLLHVLLRVLR